MSLDRTRDALAQGMEEGFHFGAQLAVSLKGERICEEAFGQNAPFDPLETDHRMLWLSACKPVAAVAVGILLDRGEIDLDRAVAEWIPDFAMKNKGGITVRHLLTHTAGFRGATLGWVPRPWEEAIGMLCATKPEPHWVPGEQAGYHVDSAWYMLGELVRVISGRSYMNFVREEIFLPLEMESCWIGMPEEEYYAAEDRMALMYDTSGDAPEISEDLSRPESVMACRPGGSGRGTAGDFLKFYEAMRRMTAGEAGILSVDTARLLVKPHRVGMFDRTFRQTMDWGLGFMLQSDHYAPGEVPYQFGSFASRSAFGHCGNQSTAAFYDPELDLCAVVLCNGMPGEEAHQKRMRGILDALYGDVGFGEGRG
jgi:CubicO group peptidase (beta-lactamase class C family)